MRPIIVAHRGCGSLAPENSLIAIERASSLGITHMEIDVHCTLDKEIVVHHDPTICDKDISQSTLYELRRLVPDLPTLEDYVLLSSQKIIIEIKDTPYVEYVARGVLSSIYGHERRMIIASFQKEILETVRLLDKSIPLILLTDKETFTMISDDLQELNCDWGPDIHTIQKKDVECAHGIKKLVITWTPNDCNELLHALRIGVDMIISDEAVFAASLVGLSP